MKKKIILAIAVCFPLILSGLIYLCFRPYSLLLFRWLDFIGFNYSGFQNIDIKMPEIFIYNLPNALFLIFGYMVLYVIWFKNRFYYYIYSIIITVLNLFYEIMTYDASDIITILITFIICIGIYNKYIEVKCEK
jgi:hypothetical protein